jgi:hypothetical protein
MSQPAMRPSVLPMWQSPPPGGAAGIDRRIAAALSARDPKSPCTIFFRADDIAVPGKQLARLMALFTRHRCPLCLAVVPAWLTRKRWHHLKMLGKKDPSLWRWHQHGWRHANHEREGKKQEFGPARSTARIRLDLCHGRDRLQSIMGASFVPVFTPPWNRCSIDTLGQLESNGFRAVSRGLGPSSNTLPGLPDLFVNVDLHTRKAPDPVSAWASLFSDIKQAVSQNYCGFMIHHRQMNDAAFSFLDVLLGALKTRKEIRICGFADLLDISNSR